MLHLRADIDPKSGFCFGVVYAVEMAEAILREEGHLYCLGEIVHNDEEIKRLEDKGLEIISHATMHDIRDSKVLIRAHGEPPSTYALAHRNNIALIDASCPVVLKLQQSVRDAYDEHVNIYIYGKRGHPEVISLLGQVGQDATVFQSLEELELDRIPPSITLYSQTTKSVEKFSEIIHTLRTAGIQVHARDTICRQVSNRDKELRSFVKNYDKVVFLSGTKSSNGKVLFEVCKAANPHTFFVSYAKDIREAWFSQGDRVGICGATSTPHWLMEDTRKLLLGM